MTMQRDYNRFLVGLLYVILVTIVGICSAISSWWATIFVRGKNYSDVGVSMYEHGFVALCTGFIVYSVVILLPLLFAQWIFPPIARWAKITGWTIIGLISVFYIPFLSFNYL